MPSIDERVVVMSFENAKFETGVAQTMATLAKLNDALAKVGAESGLKNIEAEANKVTLTGPLAAIEKLKAKLGFPEAKASFTELEAASDKVTFSGVSGAIEKLKAKLGFPEAKAAFAELNAADDKVNFADAVGAVDQVESRLGGLQAAAAGAFGGLAVVAGQQIGNVVKDLAGLKAVLDGFSDYELKISATQTIMAGTGEDIQTVSKYLKDLDKYADRTIYNLRDMTSNIGKFTNAGVKLPIAVDAMKGIANLAALSGANANEAARSMYNLGQAIGQGKVRMADWRSVELANMGTREFKEELIKAAEAAGTLKRGNDGLLRSVEGNVVNFKTFGATLQDNWLTSEALTKTLSKYSDESTNLGKRAYAAATNVKTFSMMLETLAASAGTGWTDTFEIIFGNLPKATKLWTDLTNTIGGFLNGMANARNEMLATWAKLGGRQDVIEGIKNTFNGLLSVLKPIKDAFRDIFPRTTGEQLAEMSKNFREFTESFKIDPATADLLQRTFRGFFAILNIGKNVLGEVIGLIFDLFGALGSGGGGGGFLSITASIGDFLTALDYAIEKGGLLKALFDGIGAVLKVPVALIKAFTTALFDMFTGSDSGGAEELSATFNKLEDDLRPLTKVIEAVKDGWKKLIAILDEVKEAVEPAFSKIVDKLKEFGTLVAEAFETTNWDRVLQAIQTGLIGAIFLKIKNALSGGLDFGQGGLLDNINEAFSAVTDNLKTMQQTLQAATLLQIAAAIALLAGAIFMISKIPSDQLEKAMTAVAIGMGQMVGALVALSKIGGAGAFIQVPAMAGAMVLLSGAVLILAGALKIMGSMSWEEIAKGLAGMAGVLGAVGTAMMLMGPNITYVGPAMIPLAIGINLLAAAVAQFARMDWDELGRGLFGLGAALGIIGLAVYAFPPTSAMLGPAIIGIAIGVGILAGAVAAFGSMDTKTLVQGLLGMGAALTMIGFAVALFPPTSLLLGPALILIAMGLQAIGVAVGIFGSMDTETLVKGLIGMGVALGLLAVGLTFMQAAVGGAASLLLAAIALAVLGPAIAFMGNLKWSTILKGIFGFALALGLLAVAGAIAVVPLVALGGALAVLGLGIAAIGAGVYLIAKGFQIIGAEGTKAIAGLVAAIGAFILVFPKMVIDFVKGLVTILSEVVKLAPEIVKSLSSILTTLLDAIIDLSPKVAQAIIALVNAIFDVLVEGAPKLIEAGFTLLRAIVTGLRDNMPELVAMAAEIITNFLNALSVKLPDLVDAGANLIIKFLEGLDSKIHDIVPLVAKIITTFLNEVAKAIPSVIKSAANVITKFIQGIADNIGKIISAGTTLLIKFMDGIEKAIPRLVKKGLRVARAFLNGIADGLAGLADIGMKAMIRFLNGLEKSIRENDDRLIKAGKGVGDAIIDAIAKAIREGGDVIRKAIEGVMGGAIEGAKNVLGIKSPSRVFLEIGRQTMAGFSEGIVDGGKDAEAATKDVVENVTDVASNSQVDIGAVIDTDPVITPVLDLTKVEEGSKRMGAMLYSAPIDASVSTNQAGAISSETEATGSTSSTGGNDVSVVNLQQNNYSPEPLDEVEIYRNTNNQLSQVKRSLGLHPKWTSGKPIPENPKGMHPSWY